MGETGMTTGPRSTHPHEAGSAERFRRTWEDRQDAPPSKLTLVDRVHALWRERLGLYSADRVVPSPAGLRETHIAARVAAAGAGGPSSCIIVRSARCNRAERMTHTGQAVRIPLHPGGMHSAHCADAIRRHPTPGAASLS
jgi:hypothetical protein